MHKPVEIEGAPLSQIASHTNPLLIFIEQILRDTFSYHHIKFSFLSLHPTSPFRPLSDSPSQPSPKSMSWASVLASVGRDGGQQVEHKHTCLPHPLHQPSWSCWAEGPISGPSEPCNQHCQTQLPVEHIGLTLWCVGTLGRLVGRLAAAAVLEGSMEHVKPQPVSPGAPHGWTGLTCSGAWG